MTEAYRAGLEAGALAKRIGHVIRIADMAKPAWRELLLDSIMAEIQALPLPPASEADAALAGDRLAGAGKGIGEADVERLTRPIIGIENRSALEAFDIMADRIRRALASLAPAGGEDAYAVAAAISDDEHTKALHILRHEDLGVSERAYRRGRGEAGQSMPGRMRAAGDHQTC